MVPALGGAAIADEVLSRREHALEPAHRAIVVLARILKPGYVGRRVGAGDGGILGEPLVRPAPAIVSHDRQGRREGPVLAGHANLLRGRAGDPAHQAGVVRGAETDVVGEKRRAEHVAVPVDRVDTPHDGDLHRAIGRKRRVPVGVGEREPGGRRRVLVVIGPGPATVQHRPDVILAHLGRGDALDLRLRHLADLLGEGHARDHRGDERLGDGIALDLAPDRGPVRGRRRERRDLAAARLLVLAGLGSLIGTCDQDKPEENGNTGRGTASESGHARLLLRDLLQSPDRRTDERGSVACVTSGFVPSGVAEHGAASTPCRWSGQRANRAELSGRRQPGGPTRKAWTMLRIQAFREQ